MGTVWEQALKKATDDVMSRPEWASVIAKYCHAMNTNVYPSSFIDCVVQRKYKYSYDLYDAWAFMQFIHAMKSSWEESLETGIKKLGFYSVLVGETPSADKMEHENNKKLSVIKNPFVASFWGGTQDEDGIITQKSHVRGYTHLNINTVGWAICEPGSFPLEVGAIEPYQSMRYVLSPITGFARWPYGSEYIYVFTKSFLTKSDIGFSKCVRKQFKDVVCPYDIWQS